MSQRTEHQRRWLYLATADEFVALRSRELDNFILIAISLEGIDLLLCGLQRLPTRASMPPKRIDWSVVDLGQRTDRVIADDLGVSHVAVGKARRKRGIARFKP